MPLLQCEPQGSTHGMTKTTGLSVQKDEGNRQARERKGGGGDARAVVADRCCKTADAVKLTAAQLRLMASDKILVSIGYVL